MLDRLAAGAKLAFTFSFVPHYSWVSGLPIFGSAFTLSLPLLLFLHLFSATHAGSGSARCWRSPPSSPGRSPTGSTGTSQGVTPALIAITAAILVRAWEVGWYARAGVAALVLVQIGWGGNIYFQGADRVSGAANLLGSTIGERTPENAGEVPS